MHVCFAVRGQGLRRTRAAWLTLLAALGLAFFGSISTSAVWAQAAHSAAARPAATRAATVPAAARSPAGSAIAAIVVEGNSRIEAGTIRSYMLVAPGDSYDPDRVDRSLKTLYATGLFSDVAIDRRGADLVVHVKENPIVNRIAFEGNHKFTDENLRGAIQLKSRGVFTPALAEADRQRILDVYARRARFSARVDPKIIQLPENRVDVVFEITEGQTTLISKIAFVGNHAFSEGTLRDVVASRETAWWRFLSSSDEYDPARLQFDRDQLRRFYLRHGYADFAVTNATAELSPERDSFFVTYTLKEGERYKVSKVTINCTLTNFDKSLLAGESELDAGDWYDGDAVERSVQALTDAVQNHGRPFVVVTPREQRDTKNHTIALQFNVSEGPRVYIERIDINGNVRTQDKVIRREFRVAEGDAFNAALLRRSRQRLQDLQYFNSVAITSHPGSAPDKAVVDAKVEEKSTGELTIGGGYSTDAGALVSAGIHERNLVGTGIDAGINGVLAQKQSQLDLSLTDPYFLDRNIVAGIDTFLVQTDNLDVASYYERRLGFSLRAGYEFSEHLRQVWTYSLVQRRIYNVQSDASIYVQDEKGSSLLSQVGQTLTLDYRDSRVDPHQGWVVRGGTDFAGVGGDSRYVRTKLDGNLYVPLERLMGSNDWVLAISGGAGYLFTLGEQEHIIDRFFLGGDNLRGFETGGVGPHSIPTAGYSSSDSLGGRFIWTQSTELRFPLPISPDLGLSGRAFVDLGGLTNAGKALVVDGVTYGIRNSSAPRMGTGVGVSWKTPFGLINIDVAQAVLKEKGDTTQVFRFGFGTKF